MMVDILIDIDQKLEALFQAAEILRQKQLSAIPSQFTKGYQGGIMEARNLLFEAIQKAPEVHCITAICPKCGEQFTEIVD